MIVCFDMRQKNPGGRNAHRGFVFRFGRHFARLPIDAVWEAKSLAWRLERDRGPLGRARENLDHPH